MKYLAVAFALALATSAWPGEDVKAQAKSPDETSALSAVVMDAKTHRVLWSREPDAKRYPASTTKIMTGLLASEKTSPYEIVTAPDGIEQVGESSMHLKSGESLTAQDMLYGMMLRSANDACVAMADHISGSVPAFADLMNSRAKQLGCTGTHFVNPNGLHDPEHYTTAHDLALIACAALENPRLAEIIRTRRHRVTRSTDSKDLTMTSRNKLLTQDPECIGVKTGWTIPAGKCFVGAFDLHGRTVVTVVMDSKNWEGDTEALSQWADTSVVDKVAARKGQSLGMARVLGGTSQEVALEAAKECTVPWVAAASFAVIPGPVPPPVKAPVKAGQPVGKVTLKLSDGSTVSVDVVAASDVPAKPPMANAMNPLTLVVGGGLVGAWAVMRRRRGRRPQTPYGWR